MLCNQSKSGSGIFIYLMQICFVGKDNQERQSEKSLAPHVASFFEAGKAIIKKFIRILVKINL